MNRIRNIFGRVNIFVRGSFNYVLGASSEEEDEKNGQEGLGQTDDAVGKNQTGGSKDTPPVKRKKKGKKKKKAQRINTVSRVHPRQKQIIVRIPQRPQPFNTGNLFKVPSKSHTKIDLTSAALAKDDSDKLLISEKTFHLEHAIKYGNKAEAIDVREELSKSQQPKKEPGPILPSIVVEQQKNGSGAEALASRADAKKPLMEAGIRDFSKELNKALIDGELSATRADIKKSIKESLLNSKRDETMKLFDNEFKLKTQTSKPMDEVKSSLGNVLPLSIKDETEKLKPSPEGFKPKAQETKTTDGVRAGLGNSLPSSSKKDEIKKPSFKEFKPKTQHARTTDEHKPGRQEAKLKLPDIHSCQGSLVSQPISCSDANQPIAMPLPTDKRPNLLTMVQKKSVLSTLETIPENVEEKYFNSQSLLKTGGKSFEKVARLVGETSDVCKRGRKAEASNPRLTGITQAVKFPNQNGLEKIVVKDDINVQATVGRAALEKTTVKKKSKKQKNKKKKNRNGDKGLVDGEAVESPQGQEMKLNPIAHDGKSPLERLREVESKLLAQKHLQLGKVFSRSNKVAPLSSKELGVSKKNKLQLGTSQECSTGATKAVRPSLKPLKNERTHTAGSVLPTSFPAVKVPEVLPTPSVLPRILPRCQSPKIFNKTANEEQAKIYNYRYANPSLRSYVDYEPSDEEELDVSSSRMTTETKTKKIDSHAIISPYAYEKSDGKEQKANMETQPATPKRKFSVQDRLRMGRKVMSSDQEGKESKYQARKDGTGLKVPSTGLPRGKQAQSSTPKDFVFPSTSRYSNHHLLPSLHPQSKNATVKKDDLKILELFGLDTNEF